VHAWDCGVHVQADITIKRIVINKDECDMKRVYVKGAIFFSSSRHFVNISSVTEDASTIMIDFENARILYYSAVAAIQGFPPFQKG
jgi:hypothetical protein